MAKTKAKAASKSKPEIRLKKPRNPNPPPPPVEHQFKPGQSGNPGGRPKGATILSKAYFAGLAKLVPNDPQERTYAELVASGQLIAAAKGSTPAAVEIRKATEGDKMTLDVSKLTDSELDARLAEIERGAAITTTGEVTSKDSERTGDA